MLVATLVFAVIAFLLTGGAGVAIGAGDKPVARSLLIGGIIFLTLTIVFARASS